jgi:hypothetical protein
MQTLFFWYRLLFTARHHDALFHPGPSPRTPPSLRLSAPVTNEGVWPDDALYAVDASP